MMIGALALLLLACPLDVDPSALLAEAVDLPTPRARADAAERLAKRDDVTLEQWLEAARSFAPLEGPTESGKTRAVADLVVDGETEPTEIWLRLPAVDDGERPRPLLVALHGAGGSGSQMIDMWQRTAESLGAILIAPTEAGRNQGYTGESREYRSVLEAIRWARRRHDIDENRIWLTGYSRGGHVVWDLALRFPGVFAAASPQAGGPRFDPSRGGNNMRFVRNLGGGRVRALVGDSDNKTMVRSARMLAARAESLGLDGFELVVLPNTGHSFSPFSGQDWGAYFEASRRAPWPTELTRAASRTDEAGHAWLTITAFDREVDDAFTPTVRARRGDEIAQDELVDRVIELVEKKTARVTARRGEDGTIALESENARGVRLLLPQEWIPEKGRLAVRQRGRPKRYAAKPSAGVLLSTFVERFDRTFLPVAAVDVKLR